MNTAALNTLAKRLQQATGLDFAAYRNQALFDKAADLLLLPKYALRQVAGPPLLCLAAVLLLGAWAWWQGHGAAAALCATLGVVLALINGLLLGLLRLLHQLAADLVEINALSLQTAQRMAADVQAAPQQLSKAVGGLPRASEMLLSAAYLVVLPGVSAAVERKVPLLGGLLGSLLQRAVGASAGQLAHWLDKEQDKLAAPLAQTAQTAQAKAAQWLAYTQAALQMAQKSMEATTQAGGKALRLAALPLRAALYVLVPVSLLVFGGLLWGLW